MKPRLGLDSWMSIHIKHKIVVFHISLYLSVLNEKKKKPQKPETRRERPLDLCRYMHEKSKDLKKWEGNGPHGDRTWLAAIVLGP